MPASLSADELADEWAVYETLMKDEGLNQWQILIVDESSSFESTSNEPVIKEASKQANANDREKNRKPNSLSCLFASKGADFITKAEIQAFGEGSFWRSFHFSHPLTYGMLSLSRVGFNNDRTEAIVSFDFVCGGLCAHGSGWRLTKIDGQWKKTGTSGWDIYS